MIVLEILTHQSDLAESSGFSLVGSFTRDLIASKVWLLQHLESIQRHYSAMYVLGSWYGNLALFMQLQPTVTADTIINVEVNPEMLRTSEQLLDLAGVDNVKFMLKDANNLDYQQLGDSGVVINTSLTEMPEAEWFEHIPAGTLVAMQARDNDPGVAYHSSQDIQQRYPLRKVLYRGAIQLRDPETQYQRFMTIGRK